MLMWFGVFLRIVFESTFLVVAADGAHAGVGDGDGHGDREAQERPLLPLQGDRHQGADLLRGRLCRRLLQRQPLPRRHRRESERRRRI